MKKIDPVFLALIVVALIAYAIGHEAGKVNNNEYAQRYEKAIQRERDSLREVIDQHHRTIDLLRARLRRHERQRQRAAARLDSMLDTARHDDLAGHRRFFSGYRDSAERKRPKPGPEVDTDRQH